MSTRPSMSIWASWSSIRDTSKPSSQSSMRSWKSKTKHSTKQKGRAATGTLVQKCKDLNEKITKVDQEVETMVTNFNNESHNPDKIDPENVPLNINLMLNHYFSILSNLEGETMLLTRKLQHLSDNHFSR